MVRFLCSSLILMFIIFATGCVEQSKTDDDPMVQENETGNSDSDNLSKDNKEKNLSKNESLSKEEAAEILNDFEDLLFADVNSELKVLDFSNKEALVNKITEVANRELVLDFVQEFYEERDGGLYLIPRGAPPFLNNDEAYLFESLDDGRYLLTQEATTDIYGSYVLQALYEKENGSYKVSEFSIEAQ